MVRVVRSRRGAGNGGYSGLVEEPLGSFEPDLPSALFHVLNVSERHGWLSSYSESGEEKELFHPPGMTAVQALGQM